MFFVTIIGALLFIFGLIDMIGSFAGLDVWTDWIGVQLPEIIWRFTAYIELILGGLLFKVGIGLESDDTSHDLSDD